MSKPLDNACALYLEGIGGGKPREAIAKYTGARYTQHSTGVADGQEGFIEFFTSFLARNPKRDIRILHSLADGRYAFIHALQTLNDGEARWETMDLFDTNGEGRIIEHWDVIGPATPAPTSCETKVSTPEETDQNKALVLEYMKQVVQGRGHHLLADYLAPQMIPLKPALRPYEMLFKLVGQGNLVAVYGKGEETAIFDLFRLDGGQIVDHWECIETIPPRDQWRNSGKF